MNANKDSKIKYRDFLSLKEDGSVEVIETPAETKVVLSKGGRSLELPFPHNTGSEEDDKETRVNIVRDIIRQVNIPARGLQEAKNNLKRIMWTNLYEQEIINLDEYKRFMGRLYREEGETVE